MRPARREITELGGLLAAQLDGSVVERLCRRVAERRDPRARMLRRRRKARRSLLIRSGLTGVFGASTAVMGVLSGVVDTPEVVTGSLTVVVAFAAVRAGVRVRRLYQQPLPEAVPPRPALPRPGSLAREPMQRLAAAEDALIDLLAQLGGHSGSVPESSLADAAGTARQAAATLRSVAAKITAVERAKDAAPPLSRGPLADDIRRLRGELDDGVDGYGELVAAAGRAVAATASPESTAPGQRLLLIDATQRLAGLASVLSELEPPKN